MTQNIVYWMGCKIECNLPKELVLKALELLSHDTLKSTEFTEWCIKEMRNQVKK